MRNRSFVQPSGCGLPARSSPLSLSLDDPGSVLAVKGPLRALDRLRADPTLRMYSPMVSPGSYIVVEDTHYDSVPIYPHFGPGPMAAVNKFLAEGGSDLFEQDFSREAMVMTFNPGGWLRRKKD